MSTGLITNYLVFICLYVVPIYRMGGIVLLGKQSVLNNLVMDLSYHAERVAARRMAQRDGLTLEVALQTLLDKLAGTVGLPALLSARQQERDRLSQLRSDKRLKSLASRQQTMRQKQIEPSQWRLNFDGSARPNPGCCSIGVVLVAPDGYVWEQSSQVAYGNSSEAEYRALIAALTLAVSHGASDVVVMGDSRVVLDDVTPMTGRAVPCFLDLRQQALGLLAQIARVQLRWVPRAQNQRADALAQAAFVR